MAEYRVRFEGPHALASPTAVALADADGVDLTSSVLQSDPADEIVVLDLEVRGDAESVRAAVERIHDSLPAAASLTNSDH